MVVAPTELCTGCASRQRGLFLFSYWRGCKIFGNSTSWALLLRERAFYSQQPNQIHIVFSLCHVQHALVWNRTTWLILPPALHPWANSTRAPPKAPPPFWAALHVVSLHSWDGWPTGYSNFTESLHTSCGPCIGTPLKMSALSTWMLECELLGAPCWEQV